MSLINDKYKLIVSSVGIFVSYFFFGIFQEKITRGRYGDSVNEDGSIGERFTFTLALVAVQCIFNWIFAKGKSLARFPAATTSSHFHT
jgi:solute carrier family 35 (UDP-galactose transporter), member B1